MTETASVALAGSLLAALIAILGFLVNLRLSHTTQQRENARMRYNELVSLYGDIGKSMNVRYLALKQLLEAAAMKPNARLEAKLERLADEMDPAEWSHLGQMLNLYGAGAKVNEAYDRFYELIMKWPDETNEIRQVLLDAIEGAIQRFYREAGYDAREALTRKKQKRPKVTMPPGDWGPPAPR